MITTREYPWIAEQDWSNILFMHWPVPVEIIEPSIPEAFVVDTFAGSAWISIVIFEAKNSRLRLSPKRFVFPPAIQVNVRTYVKTRTCNESGVYFFNLNVKNMIAILGANLFFSLPFQYLHTEMVRDNQTIFITGKRNDEILLSVPYCPTVERIADVRTRFLTERYCIWNVKGKKII